MKKLLATAAFAAFLIAPAAAQALSRACPKRLTCRDATPRLARSTLRDQRCVSGGKLSLTKARQRGDV